MPPGNNELNNLCGIQVNPNVCYQEVQDVGGSLRMPVLRDNVGGQLQQLQQLPVGETAHELTLGRSNEDFFQLMCHVDASLRSKIENGEFVDLEKLLPKDK